MSTKQKTHLGRLCADKDKICRMYCLGHTLKDIGKAVGRSQAYISYLKKKNQWPDRQYQGDQPLRLSDIEWRKVNCK